MEKEYITTEASRRASRKYQAKTVCIQIRVTEEEREQIRQQAQAEGKSLTQYIKDKLCNKAPK